MVSITTAPLQSFPLACWVVPAGDDDTSAFGRHSSLTRSSNGQAYGVSNGCGSDRPSASSVLPSAWSTRYWRPSNDRISPSPIGERCLRVSRFHEFGGSSISMPGGHHWSIKLLAVLDRHIALLMLIDGHSSHLKGEGSMVSPHLVPYVSIGCTG